MANRSKRNRQRERVRKVDAQSERREPDWGAWEGPDGELGRAIESENEKTLESYGSKPTLVVEHANHELDLARGGYADRQIVELTQNSADQFKDSVGGDIEVELTSQRLYFADNGTPVSIDGVISFLHTHLSPKRGNDQIGRFGLGFKSLLRVSDRIDFFSHSGSLRFDGEWSRSKLTEVIGEESLGSLPVMRLALTIDPIPEIKNDSTLERLATKYSNVVRVDLNGHEVSRLSEQLRRFPKQFILLVDRVNSITICNRVRDESDWFETKSDANALRLLDQAGESDWMRFTVTHELTEKARADRRTSEESDEVEITWVVPRTARSEPGRFWAFFPTQMQSLVSGILNAPWKTNEDRTNLLPGDFNDELIGAAAELIASHIGSLADVHDYARHLDALPRREDVGDMDQTKLLRRQIYGHLHERGSVPDRTGRLRRPDQILYPPRVLTQNYDLQLAYNSSRFSPSNSLHELANTTTRWVRVEQLNDPQGRRVNQSGRGADHPSIRDWLAKLTLGTTGTDNIEASRDAIRVAALLPEELQIADTLGRIFINQSGDWRALGEVYLPSRDGESHGDDAKLVHRGLSEDEETLVAMKTLGLVELSKQEQFRDALRSYLQRNPTSASADPDECEELWSAASRTNWEQVVDVIKDEVRDYAVRIPVRIVSGDWKPANEVMMPGKICRQEESPSVCVDTDFHDGDDEEILDSLGVWDGPRKNHDLDAAGERSLYEGVLFNQYQKDIGVNVHERLVDVEMTPSVGPVSILPLLPDVARSRFTEALLSIDGLYERWKVQHQDWRKYEEKHYLNYAFIQVYGKGVVADGFGGFVPVSDVGNHPTALRRLSELPTWPQIKEAFGLEDPPLETGDFEAVDPGEEVPILDAWPGLRDYKIGEFEGYFVAKCEAIQVRGVIDGGWSHFRDRDIVYIVRGDAHSELSSLSNELGLDLTVADLSKVLAYEDTQAELERAQVKAWPTDTERLLAAVGEVGLRLGLPDDLLAYKERNGERLNGVRLAEAAIATYDASCLKHYKDYLTRLNPPGQWAGGPKTVSFVRSLGLPDAWAGARTPRRDPYLDVDGPLTLGPLHEYQENVANRIIEMLQPQSFERRGMISLPTGAGKTRVAVEGVVRALKEYGSPKSVLWVADRDELCEQAVESWQQVWRCFGKQSTAMRVSRMWAGQPAPIDTPFFHVIVASIQTLNAKFKAGASDYDFIRDVGLVVFDEAHRSIAPTFTNALTEIGFTPRQSMSEPHLMGLTATPYRGHNERETQWLANRYGDNRLDDRAFPVGVSDAQEVVEYLQGFQILARARHEEIEGGRFSLSWEELEEIRRTNLLSRTAEMKIARNTDRTERILDAYWEHIGNVDPTTPTIIFATSVEHSMTIASELSDQGVVARSVSASTDRGTRRRVVADFRDPDGEVKVLVNYGIFREGFDAPRTKAIVVARPVWSPNLYFQMIGRGLRGVKNGGNKECLILNVEDNIENYERKLAFTDLDWLWDE